MSRGNTPTNRTPRPLDTLSTGSDATRQAQKSLFSATRVYVRIRPFNERELQESGGHPMSTVKVSPEGGQITILDPSNNCKPRLTYSFEHCFDSAAAADGGDQEVVYQHVGRFVLRNVIDGYNGCIFAYGQTGSGKTHTMMGPPGLGAPEAQHEGRQASVGAGTPHAGTNKCSPYTTPLKLGKPRVPSEARSGSGPTGVEDNNTQSMEGLIPRLARDIFDSLRLKHKQNSSHSFRVEFEYYEIYNEKVFDLMPGESNGAKTELRLRHQPTCGAYVDGLVRKHVVEEKELLRWIQRGSAERHTACTKMNDRSSRSHAILSLHIAQMTLDENDNTSRVSSKLNLVDLAGSERTGASGVEGKLFKEATKINLSLTVLGRVIDALADLSSGKHGIFCPYRDSNLTWLLMDSLGGNSKTSMVATVSPSVAHYEETCQTLRYASRAKQIVNRAIINEDPQVRQIRALTAEVSRLQRLLRERPQENHRNEKVEQLQDRVVHLEQDVADRDFTIDELRSQLLEKDVAEMKKLADENSRLQHELKDFRRAKLTVLRLQNELRAATEETEQLRAQLAALEKEKQEQAASRLILHSDNLPTKAAAGSTASGLELQLGHATLQSLKRLGITGELGDYAHLVDAVTRCAVDATQRYDAMLQKNTMMVDSHSWSLRESLKQLESKEWEVLAATGSKLLASFERVWAKRERMPEEKTAEQSTPLGTPGGTQDMGKTRRGQKEPASASATLKGMKEQLRLEKERAKTLQGEQERLQQQLDKLSTERDELRKKGERQKKDAQRLQASEKDLKDKLTEAEAALLKAEKNAELLQQNQLQTFQAVALLVAEELEAYCRLLTQEAGERCGLLDSRHASRLHHEQHLLGAKMHEVREECKTATDQAASQVRSVQEAMDLLRNEASKQKRDLVEFTAHTTSALCAQSEMWLAFCDEKLHLLVKFSEHCAATLHKSQGAILDKLARVEHDAETRVRDARSLLDEEIAQFTDTLRQKEEEIRLAKQLHEIEARTQQAAKRLEMETGTRHTAQYLAIVQQQLHEALGFNEDKVDTFLHKIHNEYEGHIQQLMKQLNEAAGTVTHLQEEIHETKNQHLQEICTQREQHQGEIEQIQLLLQQKNKEGYETQRQLQLAYNEKEKELQEIINITAHARDDALKKSAQSTQLLQAAQQLLEGNSSLHNEHTEGQWAIVRNAMDGLQAEHSARAAEMQRCHEEKLTSLQREHELTVNKLAKEVGVAKAVLLQQREDAEQEAAVVRAAHSEQVSSLVRQSCVLVAEHAAGRQSIAQQEAAARVEMAVALRQLTMQSRHTDDMHRELTGSHAAFAAHCAAEHAAWVEAAREVLASVGDATQRRVEEWRESERAASASAAEQQQCARQMHVSHVRMLLGELDSAQEWVGALSATVRNAMDGLQAEHSARAAEMQRCHEEKLTSLQREHELTVNKLAKEVGVAKAVLLQQREDAEQEAAVVRAAHSEQVSSLVRQSCVLVAEHAAGRQSIAQQEAAARVEMAVALRQLTMQSRHTDDMHRELTGSHAAFAAHCAAEHAAWVEAAREVLASVGDATQRRVEEWRESERAASASAAEQQQCARQMHVSHVRMLLGELDSAQEWVGALSATVRNAMDGLQAEHSARAAEMQRCHEEKLTSLQREHELTVNKLAKEVGVAKAVLLQQREDAEQEAAVVRAAHSEQVSSLVRQSCVLVAEHAAGRQSIAQQEAAARVEMAVALRQLTMQSRHTDDMHRELTGSHAAFAAHCAAEHAAWVEAAREVLASVGDATQRRVEEWRESERAASASAAEQQQCARQMHVSHVRMLLGELDSAQEWVGALSATVRNAMDGLQAEHSARAAEMQRCHEEKLTSLQREHELTVNKLAKEVGVAKAVLLQQREDAEQEAAVVRAAHSEQVSSLVRQSCVLVAEHAAGRQSIAQQEAAARVEMAVALRQLTMQSRHTDDMHRELTGSHAAFAAHCAAEHAAWVEAAREVLASVGDATQRRVEEWRESERAASASAAEQQQCARQMHVSHVRMLLGELDSAQEWVGALSATVRNAMDGLQAEHSARAAEMQRCHEEKLTSLQREHELTVNKLAKEVGVAKAVLLQQREDAEQEAAVVRAAHSEQVSSLVRQSCVLVAEHAAGRQSIAQQEAAARVEMAVALRQLTMQSRHTDDMHRELTGSHAAFAAHCAAEHAAWVEAAREVLASVGDATQRRVEEWRESERAASASAAEQQQCARQMHVSHVRMLLGELDSAQEWVGALSATVRNAMDGLQAEHSARAAEMQRCHEEKLTSLQREHELTVNKLAKEVGVAKAVLLQQREDAEQEAAVVRAAHSEQVSSLVRQSCVLVAEHAAGRQSIAQQEAAARVEMAVALRQLTMQSRHTDDMHRELTGSHAAFAAHCAAEHAAWVEAAREVLASVGDATQRRVEEWRGQQIVDCLRLEENMRDMLVLWEAEESLMLQALGNSLLGRAKDIAVMAYEVGLMTKALLFETDVVMERNPPPISNPVVLMLMFLEQHKQYAFEEFAVHRAFVDDVRRTCCVDSATETLRRDYDVTMTALEDHFYQELYVLQKENAELKVNLNNLRENLEFQTSLDQLEEEIVRRNAQQDTQRHTNGLHAGMYGGNEKVNTTRVPHANTGLGGYFFSLFHRQGTAGNDAATTGARIMGGSAHDDNDEQGTFFAVRTPPPTARQSPVPLNASHPSLAASSASRVNQVPLSTKKISRADHLLRAVENSQK